MTDQRFPKSDRVVRQYEFDRVHQGDTFAADNTLVIKAVENGLNRIRLGLSIGKKVGNAVCRNRWKRLIRESFRKQKADLPDGLDIVVRPRKGAKCDYDAIFQSLKNLTGKIKKRIQGGKKRAN